MDTVNIDARGLSCPQPVIKVKKAMETEFDAIEILVDNQTAVQNIRRFASGKNCEVSEAAIDGGFRLRISPLSHQ